jgi:Putative Flp pilus-assembly TadE/G-like/Putative Tad-like Flp pilus-assembly
MQSDMLRIWKSQRQKRRGVMVVLIAVSLLMIFAFVAFTVDVGWLTVTKTQLQNASDASALGSCMNLVQGFGPGATMTQSQLTTTAQNVAVTVAAANRAGDMNSVFCNGTRDVQLGQYQWNGTAWTMNWGTAPYNMARVTLHRDIAGTGGDRPLPLFFAPVLGDKTANVEATATAALLPGIGFQVTPGSNFNAGILPIALDVGTWNSLMAGVGSDNYTYNPSTGTVTSGPDGILEVDLYPSGSNLMPPGNRGTVDIGTTNNGTSSLVSQILYGLTAADLAPYGGQLIFTNVPLQLDGNPGLSAALQNSLNQILGQPRALPIFSQVSGNGANAVYTIVKFVGVRVMNVKLSGSPSQKHCTIQPCPFSDPSVIPGNVTLTKDSILAPVQLIQ